MAVSAQQRDIVVIGASSGGFEVLKTLVAGLPQDLEATLFVVWHMAPDAPGVLARVLDRAGPLAAVQAQDNEAIVNGRIYVAPPDHHLLVTAGSVQVTRGPKENRFRPSVDPLFRSAASAYGRRVIGVVLSGSLDDGAAGLVSIKRRGGIAVVQDPHEAEFPSMPATALRAVDVDHTVSAAALPELLTRLTREKLPAEGVTAVVPEERTALELAIASGRTEDGLKLFRHGKLSPFSCPECHGVLAAFTDDDMTRYRCHTGHAYSRDSLLAAISEGIEDSIYDTIRAIDESVLLLRHIADDLAEANEARLAAEYLKKAGEAQHRADLIRQAAAEHEYLSRDNLLQTMAAEPSGD